MNSVMMAMPKNLIFQGVSAIEAAGDVDGFIREFQAEARRVCMEKVAQSPPFSREEKAEMFVDAVFAIAERRLQPDIAHWREESLVREMEQAGLVPGEEDRIDGLMQSAFKRADDHASKVMEALRQRMLNHR